MDDAVLGVVELCRGNLPGVTLALDEAEQVTGKMLAMVREAREA